MPDLPNLKSEDLSKALKYIDGQWDRLSQTKKMDSGTLIGLPNEYIVPSEADNGGFTFKEMYYFDTYFINKGLIVGGKENLAEGILENLSYLFEKLNIIPNANRFYLSSRSQPPFYTSIVFDIYEKKPKSVSWLKQHMKIAEQEYETVWISELQPNIRKTDNGLSRYYDINVLDDLAEAESGWDYTTRYGGNCLDFNPVCLNSLLYKYELDFAKAHKIFMDEEKSNYWLNKARKRARLINSILWSKRSNFYFDYDFVNERFSPVWSLAAYYPMWAGIASHAQAKHLVSKLHFFEYEGGLSATVPAHDKFDKRPIPKQWTYPNGWAPLHFIVIEGLLNYGYKIEAEQIARKWLKTNLDNFLKYGVFRESYNVVHPLAKPQEGVYPLQIGFAWTNAVFLYLANTFLSNSEKGSN